MHADAEEALLQLQAEQLAVGDAQGRAARAAQVGGQQGLGVLPGPRAPFELAHVVVVGACIEISDDVDTGAYGDGSVHERRTGRDA